LNVVLWQPVPLCFLLLSGVLTARVDAR